MNRTNFYAKREYSVIEDGVKQTIRELDHLFVPLSLFTVKSDVGYYRVAEEDIMQPDLISFKLYGTEKYWWIICITNNIENPLADIIEGAILKIPSIYDIYDFYQKYGQR